VEDRQIQVARLRFLCRGFGLIQAVEGPIRPGEVCVRKGVSWVELQETAAYAGQFAKAGQLTRRAADSANQADKKETAATYEAEAAMREADSR
jgi:hypothetical protein